MKRKLKQPFHKIVSYILCIAMILTVMPMPVFAVEDTVAIANEEISEEVSEEMQEEITEESSSEEVVIVDETLSLEEQANAYLETAPMIMTRSVGILDDVIGGANNPFKISSATVLQELATLVSKNATYSIYSYANASYELTYDIDLGDMAWTAIDGFSGSFNGNITDNSGEGYTITSSVIELAVATDDKVGLFATGTGNITNVKINYTGGTTGTTPSDDTWASHIGEVTRLTENKISSATELAYFASKVNDGTIKGGIYTLTTDIDLSAYEWVAIGNSTNKFMGTFDGENHSITGLYINTTGCQGLFGYVNGGTVENLHVSGSVTGDQYVGGIVGSAQGKVALTGCSFSGFVKSTNSKQSSAGGIVGVVERVSSDDSSTVTITKCYNTGSISGTSDVGGVVGSALHTICSVQITQCYNTGAITGSGDNTGGIVGNVGSNSSYSNSITHCYNTGNISGTNYVGGVFGKDGLRTSTITHCYNTGTISGTAQYVGGIGGNATVTLTQCVSLANSVTSSENVGYLLGDNWGTNITSSYRWSGTTLTGTSQKTDGALLYYSTSAGLTANEAGATAFSWKDNGFTRENGWTIPTNKEQLPYLTDVSTDIPQNPLSNISMVTVTFEDADGKIIKTISGENSVVIEKDDLPDLLTNDTWCYVNPYTDEVVPLTDTLTRTVDTTFIMHSTIEGEIEAVVVVSDDDIREYLTLSGAVAYGERGTAVKLSKDCTIEGGEKLEAIGNKNLVTDDYDLIINGEMIVGSSVQIDKVIVGDTGTITVAQVFGLDENARIGVTNTSGNIGRATTWGGEVYTLSNHNFYVVGYEDTKNSYTDGDTIKDIIVGSDGTLRVADFIYKEDVTVLSSDEAVDEYGDEYEYDCMVYGADMWFEKLPTDTSTVLEEAGNAITTDNYKNAGYYILTENDTTDLRKYLLIGEEQNEDNINIYLHLNGYNISDDMTLGDSNGLTVFGGTISSNITLWQHSIMRVFGGTISGNVSGSGSGTPNFMLFGTFTGESADNVKMRLVGNAQLGTLENPYNYNGDTIYYDGGGIYALTDQADLYIDLSNATDSDILARNQESDSDPDGSVFLDVCTFTNGQGFVKTYENEKITLTGMTVDEANKTIYANGYNLVIQDDTEGTSTVFWDANKNQYYDDGDIIVKENADLSDWTIYGGSKRKESIPSSYINIKGGNVGRVYAGGQYSSVIRGSVDVGVAGDLETDIYMTNGDDSALELSGSNLTIDRGNLIGNVTTEAEGEHYLSVGVVEDATVTIDKGDYYSRVKNYANSTIYWTGGVVNELYAMDGSTTNLSFDLSEQTVKVSLYDSSKNAISSLTEGIKFITLGTGGAYDVNTFSLYEQDFTTEIEDSQIVEIGNDLYYAPSFSASIVLAEGTQYDSTTTATVTLSNQDLGDTVIASKAIIYAAGENGTDVEVGEVTVENDTTVYENVDIDLTNENISVKDNLQVQLYVTFDLVTGVTTTDKTTMDAQTISLSKNALDFTVTGTENVYDGVEKAVTITDTGSSLTADDFTITYYKKTNTGTLYTDATTPKEAGSYLYVISVSENTNYNATYYALGNTYVKPTEQSNMPPQVESYNNIGYMTILKELTVTPNSPWKFYGQSDATITYTYSGNVSGETPSFTGALARETGETIGSYPITIGSLTQGNIHYFVKLDDAVTYEIKEYITDAEVADLAGWQSVDSITLTAPEGYGISISNGVNATFTESLTIDTEQGENIEVTYYLRSTQGEDIGAISTAKTFTYSNDQIAPSGEITINKNKWDQFLEVITFGIYESKDLQVSITSEDPLSGMTPVGTADSNTSKATTEYYETSTAKTLEELEALTEWSVYTNSYTISAQDAEQIVVYAKLTDNVGNVTYLSSNGVIFDTSIPVISGVKNNGYYATDLNIEVLDTNLEHVTLNGQEVEPSFQLPYGTDQTYTLVATDKAENITSVVFHMYVKNVPVEGVLDNLPTVDENATEEEKESIKEEIKETINKLTESYLEELNEQEGSDTENPDTEEVIIDKVNKLDEVLVEANPTISVVAKAKVVDPNIPEDKRAPEVEIAPQGLAVAIFGGNLYQANMNAQMELSLSIAQTGGDENGLTFDVKPMVGIDGAETTVIANVDLAAPVTFRLYLNDSFRGSTASVEHVKEDGSSAFYEQKTLYQDTHGNYINLSAYEFSNFIVREYAYEVSVDGIVTEYKATETVTLTTPTKSGYQFVGWVSEGIETADIVDGTFAMPENDVVITSSWKKNEVVTGGTQVPEVPEVPEAPEVPEVLEVPGILENQDGTEVLDEPEVDIDVDKNTDVEVDTDTDTDTDMDVDSNTDVKVDADTDTDVDSDTDTDSENAVEMGGNIDTILWVMLVCIFLAGMITMILKKKNKE